jgi:hypothetical protein
MNVVDLEPAYMPQTLTNIAWVSAKVTLRNNLWREALRWDLCALWYLTKLLHM